ncbi:hypothetical protein KP509_19G006000 [Ceratopteris richardii]|uniref:Reverse transcriptase Ty1/copia-type domain-containing protein n=1 Tax=Ceratopteris richardii TaxID=49495 RepID=A0A8T2SHK0_CERRI|nr:hypothetical protein KP509_19G006000 [Ceratopteris richardii]
MCIYVDDIILTGTDEKGIQSLKKKMEKEFKISDLGDLSYFLGMEIAYTQHGVYVTQERYLKNLLIKFKMDDCRVAPTPMEVNHKLSRYGREEFKDMKLYQSLVGSLIYATLTRPDLSYAVGVLSQFMHCPRKEHWVARQRVLRYIKGTLKEGLYYGFTSDTNIKIYSDRDWAGNLDDMRSTYGYLCYVGDKLISWCSKKQHTIALSSTEAEYKGMVEATKEVIWLKTLMKSFDIIQSTPTIHGDNMSSLYLAVNLVFHARTKHIEIQYHFLREKVMDKEIEVIHTSTKDQIADMLTKILDGPKLQRFKDMACIKKLEKTSIDD